MKKEKPIPLNHLHYSDYEHPLDSKTIEMLQNTIGLEKLAQAINKYGVEKIVRIESMSNSILITPTNNSRLFGLLELACITLNMRFLPKLYVQYDPLINGFTIGDDEPIIVLTNKAVKLLDDQELLFLIGHEIGHILSRHTRYTMIANYGFFALSGLGIGSFVTMPLKIALHRWNRMSEFTADRAGLLACQNHEVPAHLFLKLLGAPDDYDKDEYIESLKNQANEFEQLDLETIDKWMKVAVYLNATHPWSVLRYSELLKWIDTGKYDKILNPNKEEVLVNSNICVKCGLQLDSKVTFCGNCGQKKVR